MITTLRLPPETEALVQRIAKRTGRSKSRVIRDALALLAEREALSEGEQRPFHLVEHLIGSVDSGGQCLSEQTGRKYTRALEQRRRGRRAD